VSNAKRPYAMPTLTQIELAVVLSEIKARLAVYEPQHRSRRQPSRLGRLYALISWPILYGFWWAAVERGWKRVPRPIGLN
jgi:hypothetical protein